MKILEVATYPPPRSGWAVRIEHLKRSLEQHGHECVVLNVGPSRTIPSTEYETVLGAGDFVRKVWRFARRGFALHAHANGDTVKGLILALITEMLGLLAGQRVFLTFHAGAIQRYFPRGRNRWLIPAYWLLFTIPRRIVCNSEVVKDRIASYGISRHKIVPIPAFSRQYLEFTPAQLPPGLDSFLQRYRHAVFAYIQMRPLFFPQTLIEGIAKVMAERPDVGLVISGMAGHSDEGVRPAFEAAIQRHGIQDRLCILDDLDHDAFLTVLQRCVLYLRTPITDGVASSVLEALALRVPVVACENGTRPAGVVTYPPTESAGLASAVGHVIAHRDEVVAAIPHFHVPDTVLDEVALLTR